MWKDYLRNHYFKSGQSILELSIFGTLIIMLLGMLISYGLRYNFQQRIIQQTFRKALAQGKSTSSDGQPSQVSYIALRDEYVPDPSNPFAVGSTMPVISSASVTANYRLASLPELDEELPVIVIDVNGFPTSYKLAGIRAEDVGSLSDADKEKVFRKYGQIYGASNVDWGTKVAGVRRISGYRRTGPSPEPARVEDRNAIVIIDPLMGQILDYDTAKRICGMLTDTQTCRTECEEGSIKADDIIDTGCLSICKMSTPAPEICKPANLNSLFLVDSQGKPGRTLGLQQNYRQETVSQNVLTKNEGVTGIQTTDTLNWRTDIYRTINVKTMGDTTAQTTTTLQSEVKQDKSQGMQANW